MELTEIYQEEKFNKIEIFDAEVPAGKQWVTYINVSIEEKDV